MRAKWFLSLTHAQHTNFSSVERIFGTLCVCVDSLSLYVTVNQHIIDQDKFNNI